MSSPESQQAHHDFVQANKIYFDEHADKLEQEHPQARQLGIICVDAMRDYYPALFDKERTKVLDYACGTGLFSLALRPHVKHIVGLDISQVSVDIYNRKAAEEGVSEEMEAVCATLEGKPGELLDAKFDLITCSAAYHHIPSIEDTTRALAYFLKPGGSLLVADIKAPPDGKELFPKKYHDVVPHRNGLSKDTMRMVFESAGLVDFEMKDMPPIKIAPTGMDTVWFIARAMKPGGERI
ncbi:hypothetical protein BN946_scf184940.g48 [Trametes cinnabarina]|uniref:Methyltransferase domain-containing protein n=1 Tax=Pycnoporus cinnabarinus TaxID=5643 RepID=A0A060SCH2_PYCCI|nr:hypothetical protein BN946_scf184940.g48 [Trametes cinnabarina]